MRLGVENALYVSWSMKYVRAELKKKSLSYAFKKNLEMLEAPGWGEWIDDEKKKIVDSIFGVFCFRYLHN